jgi:hypothetical protein
MTLAFTASHAIKNREVNLAVLCFVWVSNRIRTGDPQNHNLML